MLAALLCIFSGPVVAGRTNFSGSVGLENEDYIYSTEAGSSSRTRQRTRFDLNGRGYIWDPRFMVYNAGVSLQREKLQASANQVKTSSIYNMVGYNINTTLLPNKPNPLMLYGSRSKTTVNDFWSPSYGYTVNNLGARWGMRNSWLGRSNFYLDRSRSQSDNVLVARSDQSLQFGMDANKNLRPKQWGESDVSYGYRRTEQDEKVNGSSQRQNYFYLNDRSRFGETAKLSSNLTYYTRNDQWNNSGAAMKTKFLGINNNITVQQTQDFSHFYGLGMGLNETDSGKSRSHSLSVGANYRFNRQWQTNGTLGLSGSNSSTSNSGQDQSGKTLSGSAALMYSDLVLQNYLVNGGYSVAQTRMHNSSSNGALEQRSTMQTINLGYSRTNSRLYADSLQLSMSRSTGETSGSGLNARYNVRSTLTQSDMLQGTAEYSRFHQSKTVVYSATSTTNDIYDSSSRNTRLNFGWSHQFMESGSSTLSATTSRGMSQNVATETRSIQAAVRKNFGGALQWSMQVRKDQIKGLESTSGNKTTVESDLNYRIGKWQASARYRYRDVQQDMAPFKERSITFILKRIYGFRL